LSLSFYIGFELFKKTSNYYTQEAGTPVFQDLALYPFWKRFDTFPINSNCYFNRSCDIP